VYPPTFDWHRMVQRPHHLLWEAARAGHVVIFCNVTQRGDRAMEAVGERFYVCHNFDLLLQADLPRPTLYVNDPAHVALAGRLKATGVIFDVLDDLPAWRAKWAEACTAASEVWCASAELAARVRPLRPDARHVPNGCDFAHWAARPEREPVAAAVLPRPRIAVIGRIGPWVDVPALCTAARAMPDAHFLVVGPVETADYFQADNLRNVHCVGERFYPLLPAYAHACDAALIPYKVDDETARAAEPLKLWNLLATGKPVVASGLPAAAHLGGTLAAAPSELTDALRAVLGGEWDPERGQRLREAAAQRSWADSWRTATAAWKGAA
jgi:glycosyltransferase involved in cell wall biosynthesis